MTFSTLLTDYLFFRFYTWKKNRGSLYIRAYAVVLREPRRLTTIWASMACYRGSFCAIYENRIYSVTQIFFPLR
jgi:hypothetical protein